MEPSYDDLDVAWALIDGQGLMRVVPTDSFGESLALAVNIGALAEQQGHHPDLTIKGDELIITLLSHDEDAVTVRDYELARVIDNLLGGAVDAS